MLTQNLITDIKKGKAQYKTFVAGIGAANRLPVASNSYIVITDLLIMPFVDERIAPGNLQALDLKRTDIYEFTSRKSSNFYVIRHQFQVVLDGVNPVALQMEPPVKIDTYLVHNSEVRINIYKFPPVNGQPVTFAALDDVSEEPAPPAGFGTKTNAGTPVVTNLALGGDNQIIPVGADNTDQVVTPITGTYIDQVKSQNIAANALADPTAVPGHENGFPIINIGYVLYENIISHRVKGS